MPVDVDLQAAIVGNSVIGGIAYLRLVKRGADELAVFEKTKSEGDVTADPVLTHICRVILNIIKLVHVKSRRVNAGILAFQQAYTRPCSYQVPEIEPEHRVVLGLGKGFQRQQLLDFIVVAEMLIARIHKIRFPRLNEIDVVKQDQTAPVFLVLYTQRIGKRQHLLRILNNSKIKISVSYPAVGIIQKALALNINDLRSGRERQQQETKRQILRNRL